MQSNSIEKPSLNDLAEILAPAFPKRNQLEQKVSVQIHRLLAHGRPLTRQHVADSLQLPVETINDMLSRWWGIHYDHRNQIVAYWGLSIHPTQHHFEVDGHKLFTWCAWDTLFLPEILQADVRVESQCATTRARIRLTLSPDRVTHVQPRNAVISFMTPEAARVKENVVAHFCHSVRFFKSEDAGLAWTGQHPGTFLLTVDQAHRLGRKINAVQYPDI